MPCQLFAQKCSNCQEITKIWKCSSPEHPAIYIGVFCYWVSFYNNMSFKQLQVGLIVLSDCMVHFLKIEKKQIKIYQNYLVALIISAVISQSENSNVWIRKLSDYDLILMRQTNSWTPSGSILGHNETVGILPNWYAKQIHLYFFVTRKAYHRIDLGCINLWIPTYGLYTRGPESVQKTHLLVLWE